VIMPVNHLVLVPLTLAVGFAVGFWWGAKTTRERWEKRERRRRQAGDV